MSTARYGTWDPLGPQTSRRMTAHNVVCLHTMVGSLAGTRAMFKSGGYSGTESHFGLGENAAQGMLHWQDLSFAADANYEGYVDVISLETADYGGSFGVWDTRDAANVPYWNAWQAEQIAKWLEWVTHKRAHTSCPSTWRCRNEGIPLSLIPNTIAGQRGVGYHKQGCNPYRHSAGRTWSLAYGKGCPGPRRISQINSIIGRARVLRQQHDHPAAPPPPPPEEIDVSKMIPIKVVDSFGPPIVYALELYAYTPGGKMIHILSPTGANGHAACGLFGPTDTCTGPQFSASVADLRAHSITPEHPEGDGPESMAPKCPCARPTCRLA